MDRLVWVREQIRNIGQTLLVFEDRSLAAEAQVPKAEAAAEREGGDF